MTSVAGDEGDSPDGGGTIPGSAGARAFLLSGPDPSSIPVLIAVPHAGRTYSPALIERMRHPQQAALRLEDRLVDRLAEAVAAQTGAALLVAEAPRAMIDLNRAPDDVDWEMFPRGAPDAGGTARAGTAGQRARSGLGLIPRRLPGLGELWNRRHERADLDARIDGIHAPYHECLGVTLEALRQRWGAALLIDWHSMPSLPLHYGAPGAEFVLGDRFGASCDGGLVATAFGYFAGQGRRIAHNRPYAGGYVLARHGNPGAGLHAIQLEIDRASYLDARLLEPGEGFAELAALLAGLVMRLAETTAKLGRERPENWAEAAE